MSIERVPEGMPQAHASGPDAQGGNAASAPTGVPPSVKLQILSTEHWSLLASRSMDYNESFSRASMFLSLLSGAVVALALVAQATDFRDGFDVFALVLLPVVLFVGLATFVRLVQVNNEDVQWTLGINRLRHAYLDIDPSVGPYFVTAWHDDEYGLLVSFAARPGGWRFVHGFVTTPGMLAVVDGVLAGVLAGFVALKLVPGDGNLAAAIVAGVVTFVAVVLLTMTYQARSMTETRRSYRPRFPHAEDRPELQIDG